jgi:hypothetical protein
MTWKELGETVHGWHCETDAQYAVCKQMNLEWDRLSAELGISRWRTQEGGAEVNKEWYAVMQPRTVPEAIMEAFRRAWPGVLEREPINVPGVIVPITMAPLEAKGRAPYVPSTPIVWKVHPVVPMPQTTVGGGWWLTVWREAHDDDEPGVDLYSQWQVFPARTGDEAHDKMRRYTHGYRQEEGWVWNRKERHYEIKGASGKVGIGWVVVLGEYATEADAEQAKRSVEVDASNARAEKWNKEAGTV